jgi:gamma-glutamylcyclotransferase (GGCT)/AIG2-like uncharacterized protein YtfP
MAIVDHVFVYGTLLRGMSSSCLLDELGAEFIDNAYVSGKLYITDFPRLVVPSNDGGVVHGELYRLPRVTVGLLALDRFEREGELYTRSLIDATTQICGNVLAWSYHSKSAIPETDRILSGSYRSYIRDAQRE